MKENLITLFEYNDWANERVLESFKSVDTPDEKTLLIFSHILISQTIWLERILLKPLTFNKTMILLPLDECRSLSQKSTKDWISFIEGTPEKNLTSIVNYKNTKGRDFQNKLSEIITHVINHSSYHRGQIALLIRNSGGTPAVTDYIAYCRKE